KEAIYFYCSFDIRLSLNHCFLLYKRICIHIYLIPHIMAPHNLRKLLFCIIVLIAMTYKAHCSRLSTSAKKTKPIGICQSSVVIHGYKCEEVYVTTKDGFILNLQRISTGKTIKGGNRKSKLPPVLIQHGLLVDGITWLMNSPQQNLPMILVDQGFDVWISNWRGTRFSKNHKSLRPDQSEFWNWSWDEIAAYDLPAFTDHIYKVTGQKMHYVGHSMGTLIVLASLSERHLTDKLKSTALLCPIAYLSHMTTPLGVLAADAFLGELAHMLGLAEFNPKSKIVSDFIDILCHMAGLNCYDIMATYTGFNCCLNTSTVDRFMEHEPQSTSIKNLIHNSQSKEKKKLICFICFQHNLSSDNESYQNATFTLSIFFPFYSGPRWRCRKIQL
ncbi:Triacylglycerol lipase 2, partial [Linum grandiflorum]